MREELRNNKKKFCNNRAHLIGHRVTLLNNWVIKKVMIQMMIINLEKLLISWKSRDKQL